MNEMPKEINNEGIKMVLEKEYKNFGLYKNPKTNIRECFSLHELGMMEKQGKIINFSPNKVRR